jgi:hypothetical protein
MRYAWLAIAAALLVAATWTGLPALRGATAATAACDEAVQSRGPGTWLRLRGCAVDLFHNAMLRDATGRQTHLVMALRGSGGQAATPSRIALAAVPAVLADSRSHVRRPSSQPAEIADIDESLVVVLGRPKELPCQIALFPGIESGLAADALFVELTPEPSRQIPLILLAAALGAALLAFASGWIRQAAPAPRVQAGGGRPPVRWGLVLLTVLVGLVALARGLQWYFDPIRNTNGASTPMIRPEPASPKKLLLPPTPDELTALASEDPALQRVGIERLSGREITPEAVAALDGALARGPRARELEGGLVCQRARFKGQDGLDFLLARFPQRPLDMRESRSPGVACVAAALADRVRDDSPRIVEVLEQAVYSENEEVIHEALRGLRRIAPADLPTDFVSAATDESSRFRRAALRAIVALGAIETRPRTVLEASRIDTQHVVPIREELTEDPGANAARILARLWVDHAGVQFEQFASRREGIHHDVSAALLEIATDRMTEVRTSAEAVHLVGTLKETGALPALRRLRDLGPQETLLAEVDRTIAELDSLERADKRPLMRSLPPRGTEW